MSFLHCHTCHWAQDDFWDETYNPITWLEENYTKELLTKDLDEIIELEQYSRKGERYIEKMPRREYLARLLEQHANTIRGMEFRTIEEFRIANNPKCPGCGDRNWDID